jgi:hypothetical protein
MLVGIKLNIMQNMILNDKLKQLREIIENRNGYVVACGGTIASFEYWYSSRFLPYSREVLLS